MKVKAFRTMAYEDISDKVISNIESSTPDMGAPLIDYQVDTGFIIVTADYEDVADLFELGLDSGKVTEQDIITDWLEDVTAIVEKYVSVNGAPQLDRLAGGDVEVTFSVIFGE